LLFHLGDQIKPHIPLAESSPQGRPVAAPAACKMLLRLKETLASRLEYAWGTACMIASAVFDRMASVPAPHSPLPLPHIAGLSGENRKAVRPSVLRRVLLRKAPCPGSSRAPTSRASPDVRAKDVDGRTKSGHGDSLWLHRIAASQPGPVPRTALPIGGEQL
jgi:hypothetical protein